MTLDNLGNVLGVGSFFDSNVNSFSYAADSKDIIDGNETFNQTLQEFLE